MTILLAVDPLEHVLSHPMFGEHLKWFTNQSFMAFIAGGLMLLIFPRCFPDPTAPHRPGQKISSNPSWSSSASKSFVPR